MWGGEMRRKAMMAGVLAAILAIGGCAFNNPSKADVTSVEDSLVTMPAGWTLLWVDGDNSSSEGFQKDLAIGAAHEGSIGADHLGALLRAIIEAVPPGARYYIHISVDEMPDGGSATNIRIPASELKLYDNGVGGAFDHGEIYATRAQLKAALEASP